MNKLMTVIALLFTIVACAEPMGLYKAIFGLQDNICEHHYFFWKK